MKKYVYLLLMIDNDGTEKHKIGISNNPVKRVASLQTGNPNKIILLRQYKTDNYLKVEHWLHRKHSNSKTEATNEWRMLADEFVFSFLDDCAKADENIKFLLDNNSLFE